MIEYLLIILTLANLHRIHAREVPSPPRFVKQPPTDEILVQIACRSGDYENPFYIACEAIAEPAPKYYWIKNGKKFNWQAYGDRIVQQMGRGTLSISNPTDDDVGQYQCFAENEWGVATSNSVFVRKIELNSFEDRPPLVLYGNEGEPFKLSCQLPDGWPKPKAYWMIQYTEDGLKSINNARMSMDPEGSLWFSNLTLSDASDNFMYVCAASVTTFEYKLGNRVLLNVIPSGVSSARNIHEPIMQYVTRKNEVALRGKRIELFCIYGGTPLPQTVWLKLGKHIQFNDRISYGNYGKSLVIESVDFDDQGTYTCEVSNGVGEGKTYSINLIVLAVPYFTKEPEFISAAEGETVEFHCAAAGDPEPQIKWVHNGKPISEAPPNLRRKVEINKIIIEQVTRNDTGNYGCNATNSLGYVYKDAYVNVLALAPEIIETRNALESIDGKDAKLTCRAFGAPTPEVKWFHNDKPLTGGRFTVLDSGDLHISNVQFEDSGEYVCYAANKFGDANESCNFTVRAHTEVTVGPEYHEVAAGTQATFHCETKYDHNLDLNIMWLSNRNPIDFEKEPRFVINSDHSLTILKSNELDSGIYTCLAKTALDEAEASATLIVQDVPNPPNLQGVQCSNRDATVNWMPMGDNRAPILGYIIQYQTSFTPNKWEKMYDAVPRTAMNYHVPMTPWANYTFRVIAYNKIGLSEPSGHSHVCTTSPDVPYKNPDNVQGKGDTPGNLVISWEPMPQIDHNAPGFKYRVYWKPDIPGKQYQLQDISDWQQNRTVVKNVPSFTRYRIKVLAINERGEANVAAKEVIGYSDKNGITNT